MCFMYVNPTDLNDNLESVHFPLQIRKTEFFQFFLKNILEGLLESCFEVRIWTQLIYHLPSAGVGAAFLADSLN